MKSVFPVIVLIGLYLFGHVPAALAGSETVWETGIKGGFDSNVDRALHNEKSDSYVFAYLSMTRPPTGNSRLDWFLEGLASGTLFNRYSDLSSVDATLSPGILYVPRPNWSISVAPFIQGRAVRDTDQSAVAGGGKITLRQRLGNAQLGEYYLYKASSAQDSTYSYTENALGIFLGNKWGTRISTEVGYEYSYGDSYRGLGTYDSTAAGAGKGKGRQYHGEFSSVFNETIIKEKVNRHTLGLTVNVDWTKSLYSGISYSYTAMRGDSGSSSAHTGSASLGYRF